MQHSITVHGLNFFGKVWVWFCDLVPDFVKSSFIGPANTLQLSWGKCTYSQAFPTGFRPVDLIVADDLILEVPVVFPREARPDFKSALAIELETRLPFSADELLVHASLVDEKHGEDRYSVAVVKRETVVDALEAEGIAPWRVRSIASGRDSLGRPRELVSAFAPWPSRCRKLIAALPMLLLLVTISWVSVSVPVRQNQMLIEAEKALAKETQLISKLASEELELSAGLAGEKQILSEVDGNEQVLRLFLELRRAMPDNVGVSRIEHRDEFLRVTLYAPSVLQAVEKLTQSSENWSVALDGAISSDPVTGKERASVLVTYKALG